MTLRAMLVQRVSILVLLSAQAVARLVARRAGLAWNGDVWSYPSQRWAVTRTASGLLLQIDTDAGVLRHRARLTWHGELAFATLTELQPEVTVVLRKELEVPPEVFAAVGDA